MFKHGFLENRALPQRWNLESTQSISRPKLLSDEESHQDRETMKNRSDQSDEPMPRPKELLHHASTCSQDSCWTLNTDLDRGVSSSLASWDEDEFEKETSRRVEAFLQELDAALYEGAPLVNKQLQEECSEWAAKFPYLRVVGKQIAPPKREKGYSFHGSSADQSTKRKPRPSGSASAHKDFTLIGRRLKPATVRYLDEELAKSTIAEELLAQDGTYEELLAVDRSAEAEEKSAVSSEIAFERVSLDEPTKSEIVDALFEEVWPEVERTLNVRTVTAGSRTTMDPEKRQGSTSLAPDLPPTMLSRNRPPISPLTKKRVPSTALAAYRYPIADGRRKIATSSSRTAPAFLSSGRPISSSIQNSSTAGPFRRNSRFTKLPPIEGTVSSSHLPNVPVQKSQSSRDPMSVVSEDPLEAAAAADGEGVVVADSSKKLAALDNSRKPPVKPSASYPLKDVAVVESNGTDSIARNMQAMRIGKRQGSDSKSISSSSSKFGSRHVAAAANSTASDIRRARTVGLGNVQTNSLVIQGFQQRAFSK